LADPLPVAPVSVCAVFAVVSEGTKTTAGDVSGIVGSASAGAVESGKAAGITEVELAMDDVAPF
jgi:hypothetical protein